MPTIELGARVQIIKVGQHDNHLLHKCGMLALITDDVNCVVALDEGGSASVTIDQLKEIG